MDHSSKAAKALLRDPEAQFAQQHMSVPELAREPGKVAEACRQCGMDRTSLYE